MRNTKMYFKIAKLGALLSILIILAAIIFIVQTLMTVPFERLELVSPTQERHGASSVIEAGSSLSLEAFEVYSLFSEVDQSFDQYLAELKAAGDIEVSSDKKSLLAHRDISIPALMQNDCHELYCYQHRMSFSQIPAVLWRGLIGIEDSRFLDHAGIDPKSIFRMIIQNLREGRYAQGGSTITQQLIKNLFFSNEKKIERKLREIIVAVYLEQFYPKENILEAYFNENYWGAFEGIRIKGVLAASIFYFNKKPSQLTDYEATILVALLKGPSFFHPIRQIERLKRRTEVVLERLVQSGLITANEEQRWTEKEWQDWRENLSQRSQRYLKRSLYKVFNDLDVGQEQFQSYAYVLSAEQLILNLKSQAPELDFNVKVLVKELSTNRYVFKYYSKYERSRDHALTQEHHQVGSILKPIIVQEYIGLGYNGDDLVLTEPITLELLSGDWSPREITRNLPEQVTLKEALQRSLNRPLIHLASEVGFERLEELLEVRIPRLKKPLGEFPAQLLGASELSIQEIVELFEGFVKRECLSQDVEPGVLFWLSDHQYTTLARALDPRLIDVHYFGKTGTSNDGWDTMFVYFDGDHLGVIWVGQEGSRDQANPLRLFGSNTAYKVFENFVLNRGKRFREFQCPQ
jgi:penicillin-binding protein 1B